MLIKPFIRSLWFIILLVIVVDGGNYLVAAGSPLGGTNKSSGASAAVGIPPSILVQPQSQFYLQGQNVVLNVVVAGTGPFTYQWQCFEPNIYVGFSRYPTNYSRGLIKTIAGLSVAGFSGDGGTGSGAALSFPRGLALDTNGDLFVADMSNNGVREIASDGVITTIAGQTNAGFSGDGGAATNAQLNGPMAIATDALGNIFLSDTYNNRIRKINTMGIISTIVGGGLGGDGGPATSAALNQPQGVAVDGEDNIFIADSLDARVRAVVYNTIITLAGGGSNAIGSGASALDISLSDPSAVIVDSAGNFYIADAVDQVVCKVDEEGNVTILAGNGQAGFSGDGGSATIAQLNQPQALALDSSGNLYIADSMNNRIRLVTTNGIITTVAGGGSYNPGDGQAATNAILAAPSGLAVDPYGNLFISDSANSRIREVTLQGPSILLTISNLLANSNFDVVISSPYGSVTSSIVTLSNVFAPSIYTQPVSVLGVTGYSSFFKVTAAGTGPYSYQWYFNGVPLVGQTAAMLTSAYNVGNYQVVISNPYASVTSCVASLSLVAGFNSQIISSSPIVVGGSVTLTAPITGPSPLTYQWQSNGVNLPLSTITTLAGNGTAAFSGDGGPAINASLNNPTSLALDVYGDVYFADTYNNRIRVVWTNGTISTIAGGGNFIGNGYLATQIFLSWPQGVALDAFGNVYLSDIYPGIIGMVGPNGIFKIIAGDGNPGYNSIGDGGSATNATLFYQTGIARDGLGNLYIADTDNYRVRKVGTNGLITTVAGNGSSTINYTVSRNNLNPLTTSALPTSVAMDPGGTLYFTETSARDIRRIQPNGTILTVATNGTINTPVALAADAYGQLFVADSTGNQIRLVNTAGVISSIAGTNTAGFSGDGGPATAALLSAPGGVALDSTGAVYFSDSSNNRIRKITFQGPALTITNFPANSVNYNLSVINPSIDQNFTFPAFTVKPLLAPQNLTAVNVPNQGLSISFMGSPSNIYMLQETSNLSYPTAWQTVATNLTDNNGNWVFLDTTALTNSGGFYRAVLP